MTSLSTNSCCCLGWARAKICKPRMSTSATSSSTRSTTPPLPRTTPVGQRLTRRAGLGARRPDRLHQLVSNLLTNGWVHTPPGVTVTTLSPAIASHKAPYAELTVADDGPAFIRNLLPHLFDRFVRAKDAPTAAPEMARPRHCRLDRQSSPRIGRRRIRWRPHRFPGASATRLVARITADTAKPML